MAVEVKIKKKCIHNQTQPCDIMERVCDCCLMLREQLLNLCHQKCTFRWDDDNVFFFLLDMKNIHEADMTHCHYIMQTRLDVWLAVSCKYQFHRL